MEERKKMGKIRWLEIREDLGVHVRARQVIHGFEAETCVFY